MAEKASKPDENEAIDSQESTQKEGGNASKFAFLKRFRPLLIVSAIIIVECIGAFFFAPSGSPVLANGDLTPEQLQAMQKAGFIQEEKPEEKVPCVEIDMGEFSVTYSSKSEGTTTQASFYLFGVVPYSEEVAFRSIFEEKENRIRDLVRSIIRESDISDLAEPGLGLIKRRILEKVNRELGKPMLREVVFRDYSFFER